MPRPSATPPAHRRGFGVTTPLGGVERRLSALSPRYRVQDVIRISAPLAQWMMVAVLIGVTAARLTASAFLGWMISVGSISFASIVIGRAMVRRVGPYEIARRTDASLGLHAQLATALELTDAGTSGELAELQIERASRTALAISPSAAIPLLPRDPVWRRTARVNLTAATVSLAAAVLVGIWPSTATNSLEATEPTLVLADARTPSESPAGEPTPLGQAQVTSPVGDAVEARTNRPGDTGTSSSGLLGQREDQAQPHGREQQGDASRGAPDAASQATTAAQRGEALQKLGDALRQAQASRAAGESLRRGDTERAADQLNQLADQIPRLPPSERESLAEAFNQAGAQTSSGDRQVSEAAKQAAQALSQYKTSDARDAIRREASAVRQAGDANAAERDRDSRARDLARSGQATLPERSDSSGEPAGGEQGSASGDQPRNATGRPGQNGQPGQGAQGRDGSVNEGSLGNLEQQLRAGGLDGDGIGSGQGSGAGRGIGSTSPGPATRLDAQSVPVSVQAQEGDGPSTWRPPRPDTPLVAPPPAPAVAAGPASNSPVGAGPDINAVPREYTEAVRQYFLPERAPSAGPASAPAGIRP
ncbi:MAG: hypothetical protein EXR45_07915 [Chloroflexi bacterium]|nr:hypothetical protein [Chloroflexota bacterium]